MQLLNSFLDAISRFNGLAQFIYLSVMLALINRIPNASGDAQMDLELARMNAWMIWINGVSLPEPVRRRMRLFALVQLGIAFTIFTMACGVAEPTPTVGPKVIQTEGLTPTATPVYTPTPYPTYTPYPIPEPTPDIEAIIAERLAALIPTATPAPTPTPEPTPTMTPQAQIRPVQAPASNVVANILQIGSLSISGRLLNISGTIEGQSYAPTAIQVWQSYDAAPYSETCSTEKPVAFIRPGNGSVHYSGQSTSYDWYFCRSGFSQGPITDNVPWLYSNSWSYELRKRIRTFDPYIYDFSTTVNLDHQRVRDLEYGPSEASGWRVIIWSNETIIANQWLPY